MATIASFIGGILDGQTRALENDYPEYKAAVMLPLSLNIEDFDPSRTVPYNIHVYRRVIGEIFWLKEILK